jgi:hypothetical protein
MLSVTAIQPPFRARWAGLPAILLALLMPMPAVAATRSFAARADGWVGHGSGGYGHASRLWVSRTPARVAYLRFRVRGLEGVPDRVALRLHSLSRSARAGMDVRGTVPRRWREGNLSRRTAPRTTSRLSRHGRFARGPVSFDLTPVVRGNGTYTFALTTRGRRALTFAAREAGARRAPRLIVELPGAAVSSSTRPPGSPVLDDDVAASRVRAAPEIRPDNAGANATLPTADQLRAFRSASSEPYSGAVTGGFSGTTDEIIQWAAWKWGVDEDVMRAAAVQESDWHQDTVSDGGVSFGIFSVKTQLASGDDGWPGTFPLAGDSTSFNADYYGRAFRSCYDGRETWLGDGYAKGDLWGCVGLWFSGDWYGSGAQEYIALVQRWLDQREWTRPGY